MIAKAWANELLEHTLYCQSHNNIELKPVIRFHQFLEPVYYWKTVEIMITDINYSGIIGSSTYSAACLAQLEHCDTPGPHTHTRASGCGVTMFKHFKLEFKM
jgi:hypothetical protein